MGFYFERSVYIYVQTKQHCGSKNTCAHVHLMLCILSLEAFAPSTWTRRFPSWGNWFTTRTSCSYWTGTRLRVRDVYCTHTVLLLCSSVSVSDSVLLWAEPYMLIMEYVNYGTLRTYLQANRSDLSADPELQSLLTIASYHIALALQHLRSKMVTSQTQLHGAESCYQLSSLTLPHRPAQ